MVVEDERIVAMEIQRVLKRLGYVVPAVAFSGEEAIQKVEQTRPDLVLMDIKLKGDMDGIDAAEQIRLKFHIPVVYLTAYTDETTLQRAKITEPYSYVVKPIRERELHAIIEMAVHKHKAERALWRSEERFRELADLLPQTVFEIDLEGNLLYTNRYGFQSSGYTQEDIDNGLNAFQLFIPEDMDRVKANIRKILNGESLGGNEYTIPRKDGSTFPVIVYSSPIVRENKPVGLRGIVVDITERKQREEALKESNRRLEETLAELKATQQLSKFGISLSRLEY